MLFQKILIVLVSIFTVSESYSQIQIDRSIILIGTTPPEQQVNNLGYPLTKTSAIRTEDIKYGQYNLAECSGTDTLILTFNEKVDTLVDGDLFFFIPPSENNNDVFIKCDFFLAPFPLMLNGRDTVTRGSLISGKLAGAIYSGGKAFLITPIKRTCPNGYIKVNDNYCIEKNERQSVNFFAAVTACNGENAELCNWAEWYFACLNSSSLTLTGMVNNYEWLDDAANASLQVKVVGNGSCSSNTNSWSNTGNQPFRCCYRLK